MITLKKLKKAVNDQLEANFDIEVSSTDIKEGFKRPSFFVEFDEVNRSGLESQVEKSLIVRIYYFPKSKDDASIEILDIQEELGNAFDTHLPVEERLLHIIEANSNVSDGVLQFEFDLSFQDGRYVEDHELMQELDVDIKKG